MKKFLVGLVVGAFSYGAFGQAVSALMTEFNAREAMKLTPQMAGALTLLKTISYDQQGIVEFEMVDNALGTFLFRDRNGNICFGNYIESSLRCKNEIGLSSFDYKGDSD